ncbi:adhesion G protein-coupled receptor E3 isoform X1 [Dipodomys merriami]|uniref:adhesion G protein-coupled receptor E3 isoform X1 n=1 Tax=Dipodomys merriami TaxID=94247 RepID=UPI003855C449
MQRPWLLPGFCFLLSLPGAMTQYASYACSCPQHASCVNSTACTCNPGYTSSSGQKLFTFPLETCDDVDECAPPVSMDCGPNAQCHNLEGTFECRCKAGFELASGGVQFKYSKENTCRKTNSSKTAQGHQQLQEIVNKFESLLTNQTLWRREDKQELGSTASSLLQDVESSVLEAALKTPRGKIQEAFNRTMAVATQTVGDKCSEERKVFTLDVHMNSMQVHCDDVIEEDAQGPSAIAFISYSSLGHILNETFFEETEMLQPTSLDFQEKKEEDEPLYLNSQIVSAALGSSSGRRGSYLPGFVTLTLQHVKKNPRSRRTLCVYWAATSAGGHWDTAGCFLVSVNGSHTVCNSTHLSSFAVLMALTNLEADPALALITQVGLGLSLLCLLLAALTFLLCRAIRNLSTTLHLQLSICLFLAHLLFLTAIHRTEPKVLCAVIAGALHYLYLAAFTWMLLEALHLFLAARHLTVLHYSGVSTFRKWLVYPAGYGLPAVVVGVSAAARPRLYGSPERCWLQLDQGFIWGFLGPVCVIVSVNLVFLASVLWILKRKLSSLNSEVSTIQNTRMLTLKATAQVLILGCTWILGVLQVGPAARVMAYLFTIVNSLQGVFLFLVYCLLSQQVRKQYQTWFTDITKTKSKSETYVLSSKSGGDTRPSTAETK